MIKIGVYNTLKIDRETSVGLYLTDNSGSDVLLPNKYCPDNYEIGQELKVFVYLDHYERKIATTLDPKIQLYHFGFLKVNAVSNVGAFMDWGLEKDLLVPFSEQRQEMEEDRWYLVYMDLDEQTGRLYASNRLNRFIQNDMLTVSEGDEVDMIVMQKTDVGYNVIVNEAHRGLVYDNEIFSPLRVGQRGRGYIKKVREDNKLDISLQPTGYSQSNDKNVTKLVEYMQANEGVIQLTDKSAPELIYETLGISKKSFKKAVGALYKQRMIQLEKDHIKWTGSKK